MFIPQLLIDDFVNKYPKNLITQLPKLANCLKSYFALNFCTICIRHICVHYIYVYIVYVGIYFLYTCIMNLFSAIYMSPVVPWLAVQLLVCSALAAIADASSFIRIFPLLFFLRNAMQRNCSSCNDSVAALIITSPCSGKALCLHAHHRVFLSEIFIYLDELA